MGAITSLEHRSIAVQPGGEATCVVLVRNTGTVVDQFTVDVLGAARDLAEADPAVVNLLPDEESPVVVRFRPPRSPEIRAGALPFGIRVSSREDPAGTVVEEGTLDIEEFTDIRVELVPRRPRGRRRASCEAAVDNFGNHPVDLDIDALDPDQNLRFNPEHTELTLEPGTAAFVGLLIRPERRFLQGPERVHPFQVRVTGDEVGPVVADGAMVQGPLLPKWLPLALAALLALLVGLVVLWFTVVRGAIRSTARAAVDEQVQDVAATANEAKAQSDQALQTARGEAPAPGSPAGGGGAPAGPGAPGAPGAPAAGAPVREPIAFRIPTGAPIAAGPDDFTPFSSQLPADRTVTVADLVLQNPLGDSGILRILRVAGNQETVLLEVGLNNFRDLDYHFVQPLRFLPGEQIVLAVNCQNPPERNQCTPSASFSGVSEGPPAPPAPQ